MTPLILFWHRRDLRLTDNIGLSHACTQTPKVIGLFCLDPNILNRDDMAPVRVAYMMGCLKDLAQSYAKVGGQLLILKAKPEEAIPRLAVALQAKAVYWNLDVEPYARERDRQVTQSLTEVNIAAHPFWDQFLHEPGEVLTGSSDFYTVYTPFWRNWSSKPKQQPFPAPTALQSLTDTEQSTAVAMGVLPLPTAPEIGFLWDNSLIVEPGEAAAQTLLDEFCHRAIANYQEDRNIPSLPGTSLLSAPLKFGVIGIRTLWQATITVLSDCRSDEARASIQTWRQELAWREFYQHALYAFPDLANGPYRQLWQTFPWEGTDDQFQAWCLGQTGYPIVDAAMRQLNQTGWMHNRCRMIVASFLTKDLIINWQWGEKYFMQNLIDGDLAANNGGWQWSASSGMDPKPLRIFNPYTQAQKFDGEADYIRQWIPELRGVEIPLLLSGQIPDGICDRAAYPKPIVNHSIQQRRFKELYQQQK